MIVPRNPEQTPPGMWRYKHPETGYQIGGAFSLGRLIAMVNDYTDSNHLSRIDGLPAKIVAYICEQEPDYCHSTEPPTLAERAVRFTKAMAEWISNGAPVVPFEVFDQRLKICESCYWWRGNTGYGKIGCGKCGCSGKKLWFATESCPDNPKKWEAYVFNR